MNYNYPYQSYMQPQQPVMQAPQQQSSGIVWVQGEAGAKSYLLAPGQSVLLMDSEESKFYIKSSDLSGIPMPLRVFEYKELSETAKAPATEYVTRKEFDELVQRLKEMQHE